MAFGLDLGNLLVHLNLDASQYLRTARTIEKRMEATATKLTSIGTKMSLAVTLPLALMGRSSVKTFASLEEGFIGVEKTVNASTEQLSALKSGFEDMSRVIPVTITDLFKIGEAAGQLGIETDKILDFTKVMAMLGATTNLSSEEAATALARFANIVNMSQDNFDRLGATIVGLGNSLETTEAEIVSMALRLGSAGSQIGLTESEILSLAAALSSVGIQAEAGGSSFSKVMLEMNTAVKSSTESLGIFADVSRMSGKEFSNLFNRDSSEALTSFVEGLVSLRDSGQDLMPIFDGIGLGGIRVIDIMGRLSGRTGALSGALEKGSRFWDENVALIEEAEKKFRSFNSQIIIFKNQITLASAKIGKILAPKVLRMNNLIIKAVTFFDLLNDETKITIVNMGLIASVVGPATVGLGLFVGSIRAITFGLPAMNLALLTTIGHFGLALLPIAALIAVGYSLRVAWANNLTLFGEDIDSWLDAIQDSFAWFSDTVLGEMGKSFVDTFALTFKLIKQNSNEFLSNLFASFTGAFTWLKAIKEGIENGWKSITFDGMFKEFKRGYENANKDWAESFADAVRKNDKEIEKMVKFTKEAFKKVENTSKGFIIAVDKQAEEVGEAFKTQFTKDIDSMIKTLRSKLPIIENLMESLDFNSTDDDASNRLLNSLKKQAEDTIKMLESVGNAAVKTAKKTDEAGKQFTDKAIARFAEFQQSLTSIMEQGLMNMVEDWKSWKDTVISMLREVYFEAVRIAFITPAAKASAQGLTDAGKYIFKAFNIGLTSTGTSSDFGVTGGQIGPAEAPGLASGGTVERTGWAMVHKGEEFSGVGKTLGGNGNLNFKLHYEGQPLVVSKQQSFIQNEQQFAEVWLALADTNQAVRSKVKGLK